MGVVDVSSRNHAYLWARVSRRVIIIGCEQHPVSPEARSRLLELVALKEFLSLVAAYD
jgi:hypothetical protein